MNKELENFKYLFDDSRLPFINERGTFLVRPSKAQAQDWHRKMVTIFSGDNEEIDMMDDILLNPKNANPYISCMYINVLIDKIKNDYVNTDNNFRKRAYKSMLDNAIVCGELGTRNIALSLEKNFLNNEDGFGNKKFNPFTFDKDATETQKEVINTIWRIFNLRKKHKEEICLYLKDKKQKSPDDFAK